MKSIVNKIQKLYIIIINKYKLNSNSVEYTIFPKINGIIYISNKGKVKIGNNVRINSGIKYNPIGGSSICSLHVSKGAEVIINDNSAISNTAICCRNRIEIQENVYIGGDCRIYDTDFHSLKLENRISINDNDIKSSAITIKKGAFIGASCIILKGVIIGENSIIGAGSVVTKSIPDNQIWAGNPAKFIRHI